MATLALWLASLHGAADTGRLCAQIETQAPAYFAAAAAAVLLAVPGQPGKLQHHNVAIDRPTQGAIAAVWKADPAILVAGTGDLAVGLPALAAASPAQYG